VQREGHLSVLDTSTRRMVMFGGSSATASLNDLWLLTNADGQGASSWTRLSPLGNLPAPRTGVMGGYAASANRMIGVGGIGSSCFNDTWVLSNASPTVGAPLWSLLPVSGLAPPGRDSGASVYDPGSNRLIIFGGECGQSASFNDVWVLVNANGVNGTAS